MNAAEKSAELIAKIPVEHQTEVWRELNTEVSEMDAELNKFQIDGIDQLVMRESKIRNRFKEVFLRLKFEEYVRIERDKEAYNTTVKAYDEKVRLLEEQVENLKRQIK